MMEERSACRSLLHPSSRPHSSLIIASSRSFVPRPPERSGPAEARRRIPSLTFPVELWRSLRTFAGLLRIFTVRATYYCFAIDTTSTDSAIYNSREGTGQRPALVIQVAP